MLKQMESGDSIAEIVPISHYGRLRRLLLLILRPILMPLPLLAMMPQQLLQVNVGQVCSRESLVKIWLIMTSLKTSSSSLSKA